MQPEFETSAAALAGLLKKFCLPSLLSKLTLIVQ